MQPLIGTVALQICRDTLQIPVCPNCGSGISACLMRLVMSAEKITAGPTQRNVTIGRMPPDGQRQETSRAICGTYQEPRIVAGDGRDCSTGIGKNQFAANHFGVFGPSRYSHRPIFERKK